MKKWAPPTKEEEPLLRKKALESQEAREKLLAKVGEEATFQVLTKAQTNAPDYVQNDATDVWQIGDKPGAYLYRGIPFQVLDQDGTFTSFVEDVDDIALFANDQAEVKVASLEAGIKYWVERITFLLTPICACNPS